MRLLVSAPPSAPPFRGDLKRKDGKERPGALERAR